jgi:hypothetical protein
MTHEGVMGVISVRIEPPLQAHSHPPGVPALETHDGDHDVTPSAETH